MKKINKFKGFTILELTIVIAIIGLIAVALFILLNPFKQIQKSQDSKRKHELSQINKVLEDYYNDKQCYPRPQDICYKNNPPDNPENPCYICGNDVQSPDFSPYLSRLPCDPQHPAVKYLYEVDQTTCPTWYRIYAKLSNTADPVIVQLGCQGYGCGSSSSSPTYGYNYGVTSPNTTLGVSNDFVCCDVTNKLQSCFSYSECLVDNGCRSDEEIYAFGSVTEEICQ